MYVLERALKFNKKGVIKYLFGLVKSEKCRILRERWGKNNIDFNAIIFESLKDNPYFDDEDLFKVIIDILKIRFPNHIIKK